jgi:hypothetical protein
MRPALRPITSTCSRALIEPAALEPPPPQRYPLLKGQAALQSPADGGVLGKPVLEPESASYQPHLINRSSCIQDDVELETGCERAQSHVSGNRSA